ncbi:MAG: hypothetical protein PVG39_20180 [Desulfobacteraceae bacterium]
MKTLIIFIVFISNLTVSAHSIYVDSNTGDDKNPGTKEAPVFSIQKAADIIKSPDNNIYKMKINPGIYILKSHVKVATEKKMSGKRIVIEAGILPDDPSWTPDKMPIITSQAKKGEIDTSYHFVVSFLVEESHVTFKGIKFSGYFYPNAKYFPVARFNKTKTDLLVEQCMFVGETESSQVQVGVIAHGNKVMIDHRVFYKVRNTTVFFQDSGDGIKTGNGITNSIIYGANQAVWTVSPDKDFKFENNIVSDCRYAWVKDDENAAKYYINNCLVVNNKYYQGIPGKERLNPAPFEISENNLIKKGSISLRLIDNDDRPRLLGVDDPLSIDYMHIIPGTLGYDMGAGIFKHRRK